MSEHALLLRHARRFTAILCLVSVVAGCALAEERQLTHATWRQAAPLPKPSVETVPISHAVAFAPPSQQVSDVEREALLRFLRHADVQAGDTVALTIAPPEPGQPDQTAARLMALRTLLARFGVSVRTMPGDIPGVSGNEILVTARTLAVVAPDCPGYNAPIALDFEQRPILNFGCANAANLGLMVANPADLVEGRPLPPADGEAAALSVLRYRAGQITPLKVESTN